MLRPLERMRVLPKGQVASSAIDALTPLAAPAPKRILDFDIENRPLSYWYDGRCTAEITAIAWRWVGVTNEATRCYLLGSHTAVEMLGAFREAYREADMVTGHYIRRHDLPIVNGALIEHGLEPLDSILTSDTKLDLVRFSDLPQSQEALGAMLSLEHPKVGMSQSDWRDGNRLTPTGILRTRNRVVGDVEQHVELRAALLERGLLGAPRWWHPSTLKRRLG